MKRPKPSSRRGRFPGNLAPSNDPPSFLGQQQVLALENEKVTLKESIARLQSDKNNEESRANEYRSTCKQLREEIEMMKKHIEHEKKQLDHQRHITLKGCKN